MKDALITVLKDFGLEEKEARTYLALLGLGESTIAKLAEKTNIDRTFTYQIAGKLIEKGVASYVVKNNVRYFTAADPDTLVRNMQKRQEELKKALPELKSYQKSVGHPTKVEIYQGREGINTILRMILREENDYAIFGGATEACKFFELENIHFVQEAEKLKLKGKILARKGEAFFIGANEDFRFVEDELITSTTMMLWGSKTAIFVWTEPYNVILINNSEITKGNLSTFNHLWKTGTVPTKSDKESRLL